MTEQKESYKNFIEDIARIWLEYLMVYSVDGIDLEEEVTDEEEGLIDCRFEGQINDKSKLLLDSMVLGLREIKKQYGKTFIDLTFEEV